MVQTLCLHIPERSLMFLDSASGLHLHYQALLQLEVHFCFQAGLILSSVANLLSPKAAVCLLLTEPVWLPGSRERRIGPDPHHVFDRRCTALITDHSHSQVQQAIPSVLTGS